MLIIGETVEQEGRKERRRERERVEGEREGRREGDRREVGDFPYSPHWGMFTINILVHILTHTHSYQQHPRACVITYTTCNGTVLWISYLSPKAHLHGQIGIRPPGSMQLQGKRAEGMRFLLWKVHPKRREGDGIYWPPAVSQALCWAAAYMAPCLSLTSIQKECYRWGHKISGKLSILPKLTASLWYSQEPEGDLQALTFLRV